MKRLSLLLCIFVAVQICSASLCGIGDLLQKSESKIVGKWVVVDQSQSCSPIRGFKGIEFFDDETVIYYEIAGGKERRIGVTADYSLPGDDRVKINVRTGLFAGTDLLDYKFSGNTLRLCDDNDCCDLTQKSRIISTDNQEEIAQNTPPSSVNPQQDEQDTPAPLTNPTSLPPTSPLPEQTVQTTSLPTPTPAFSTITPLSPLEGQIAFISDRDGGWKIYSINSDGSGLTRLTDNLELEEYPVLSPDGQQIAFLSVPDENNWGIYIINSDGSGLTRLTSGIDTSPTWSPDGQRLAFTSTRDDPNPIKCWGYPNCNNVEIYVMNADGSDQTRLTNSPGFKFSPNWSPDGKKISFIGAGTDEFISEFNASGGYLHVMNADGSDLTRLTEIRAWFQLNTLNSFGYGVPSTKPTWTPDSKQIAFRGSMPAHFYPNIYLVNADGSNEIRLTDIINNDDVLNFGVLGGLVWSPDGQHIFFGSEKFSTNITVITASNGSSTRLIDNINITEGAFWSSDGQWIAFTSDAAGDNPDIYVMKADGSNLKHLINDPARDVVIGWLPK